MELGERLLALTVEYMRAVEQRDEVHDYLGGVFSTRDPREIGAEAEAVVREIARG